MKIMICWAGYAGYLAACWRELYRQMGDGLQIFAEQTRYPYDASKLLDGLPIEILDRDTTIAFNVLKERLLCFTPDVVIVSGWRTDAFRKIVFAFPQQKFILAMDTPWRNDYRQWMASIVMRGYLHRFSAVFVTGERGREYASHLGFKDWQIYQGVYGFAYKPLSTCYAKRLLGGAWPKAFLFLGRISSEKGLDTLAAAYRKYRTSVPDPWPLRCYGHGEPAKDYLVEGMCFPGFRQPSELESVFLDSGVFVLPSHYEPWGVVIAEAAASGLPVICSSACCSGIDIVRDFHTGLTYPDRDANRLSDRLVWMHTHYDELPQIGKNAQVYAEAYSANNWALKVRRMAWEILQ